MCVSPTTLANYSARRSEQNTDVVILKHIHDTDSMMVGSLDLADANANNDR